MITGYYGHGAWSEGGCIPCFCSNHTTDCESAADWHLKVVSSVWSLLDGLTELDLPWTGVDQQGNVINVDTPILVAGSQTA